MRISRLLVLLIVVLTFGFLGTAAIVSQEDFEALQNRVKAVEEEQRFLAAQLKLLNKGIADLRQEFHRFKPKQIIQTEKQADLPKVITISLKDFPPSSPQQLEHLIGNRVFGPVYVASIEPSAIESKYKITAIDRTGEKVPSGTRMKWRHGAWWQVRCVFFVPEDIALRIDKKKEMNIVGTITRAYVRYGNQDKGEAHVMYLELSNVDAG